MLPRDADIPIQPKRSWWRRYRSAITGRFVTERQAEVNHDTTLGEKVDKENGGSPDPPFVR